MREVSCFVFRLSCCVAALAFLASANACSSEAVNKDRANSFLTSGDMVKMTDEMAHGITADPDVARIIAQKPMIIVMKPIRNETNEIIRPGEKEMYVHRVRVALSREPALRNKFVFVLNKADYYKLQQEEHLTPDQLGAPEERVQPEYALWGTFYANTNAGSSSRSDTYLCTFRLTRISGPEAATILWEGKYETAKRVEKHFLD